MYWIWTITLEKKFDHNSGKRAIQDYYFKYKIWNVSSKNPRHSEQDVVIYSWYHNLEFKK